MDRYNRRQESATGTDKWISCTPGLLVYTPYATKRQLDIIGWLRDDFPENRNEQGGWLIGRYIRNSEGKPIQGEVIEIFQAKTECRLPGYIEWSAMEEIRLQQEFFKMKENLAVTDPKAAEETVVIGWWHTHPNGLSVFMSGTDMETQRLKYYKPEKYAVVLNPHRGIYRAFAGKNADEVAVIMLREAKEKDSTPERKGKQHKSKKDRKKKKQANKKNKNKNKTKNNKNKRKKKKRRK